MTKKGIERLLAKSRITQVHGITAGDDGASVQAVATVEETGADGMVNNAFLTLLLLAAAHTLYGKSTPVGGFTVTPRKGRRAKVGDRLIARAWVHRSTSRVVHGRICVEILIAAEATVDGVVYATGRFKRRQG